MNRHAATIIKEAKQLRLTGHTLGEIVSSLGLPKTTIWHHIKDLAVPEEYTKVLAEKQAGSIIRASREWNRARQESLEFIPKSLDKKKSALIAAMLYWGEGAKRDFNITNSDPSLIRLFMHCMENLGVGPENFALHIRTYEDIEPSLAIRHWMLVTKIPRKNITGLEILKGKKKGKLEFGMCRVRLYKGGYYLKLLTAVKEHIMTRI